MTQTSAPPGSKVGTGKREVNPFVVLGIVLTATFMQLLDISIVNVASFSMQESLHASYSDIQLVLAGYQLGFACTLITGGRLGDIYGRRRIFMIGMAGFVISSATCGAAVNANMLTISRVVQGVFSGMMFPQVLSVIQVIFEPKDRGKAFSVFGATLGLGTVLGPVTGGLLIQAGIFHDAWRSIFYVNVPIGLVGFFGAALLLPESKAPDAPKLDILGAVLVAAGLGLVIYPLTEGRTDGWPAYEIAMIIIAVPILAWFGWLERSKTKNNNSPLLDTGLFQDQSFRVGALMSLTFFAGIPAFFFTFSLFMQAGQGFTALGSGLTSFSFSLGVAFLSARSDPIAQKLGRGVLMIGTALLALGMVGVILTVQATGLRPHIYSFIPAMVVAGAGMGLFIAPLSTVVLAGVTPKRIGAASGSISTVQQVGGAVGVAIVGIIFFGQVGDHAAASVQTERSVITAGLEAHGVPAALAPQVYQGFEACYVSKAKAPDPTAQTPTCAALQQRTLPGASPQQTAELSSYLQSQATAGSTVTRRDYVHSISISLVFQVVVFLLAFVLVFFLPKADLRKAGPPGAGAHAG